MSSSNNYFAAIVAREKTALLNLGSVRGYVIIKDAKRELEKTCPKIVSCAHILAVVVRDASTFVGGPSWTVKLGRRDSTTVSHALAETDFPGPFDPLGRLISGFAKKGLSTRDMVALSGAHSIGQAQCFLFRNKIYSNATDIDVGFASSRRRQCPRKDQNGNLAPLDLVTPNQLDNNYFKNLRQRIFFICSTLDKFLDVSSKEETYIGWRRYPVKSFFWIFPAKW
ncbi:lignin-forming anionic peroxidase-like [Capsicum annuum]|uniref:lignin-forming anionic peroxidase-like n=1 Tax=Capsicum annuum TaxID=4072 RepID=UPI001FB18434|nr:lignin-forming anionic peroxidase-like [Capsicum annuum]